jgi:glucose-1-phosphate cytidylyltransferase
MKGVILCGGRGSRLSEETEVTPKPLVEIGGKPILWHIMKIYAQYGFKEFVLAVGYKGALIKEYFYNYRIFMNDFTIKFDGSSGITYHNGDAIDWEVTVVDTGLTSLKGARIKKTERFVDGDEFMLTYGDGVADVDIKALLSFHRRHGRICTLTGVRPPSRFGDIVCEKGVVRVLPKGPRRRAAL